VHVLCCPHSLLLTSLSSAWILFFLTIGGLIDYPLSIFLHSNVLLLGIHQTGVKFGANWSSHYLCSLMPKPGAPWSSLITVCARSSAQKVLLRHFSYPSEANNETSSINFRLQKPQKRTSRLKWSSFLWQNLARLLWVMCRSLQSWCTLLYLRFLAGEYFIMIDEGVWRG
jgi:hypothetical protein